MMEIAIHGNMDVSTVTKWPPEEIASEAYGAALHEQWSTRLRNTNREGRFRNGLFEFWRLIRVQ